MNDVFISYSRRDKVFTQKLYEALKAVNREVWADWDSIPAASDWDAEIKQGIQETNSVLFVLSPEWIKSNECRKELVHAVTMGKRLFPILYLPVDPNDVPPELAKINWVYMRDTDDFDKAFQTLCSAMDTDLDWIKTHTRIQVRALEWDRKKRDHSFVLRGNDLTEGEQFIAGAANKSPVPTALQSEYILASRTDATKRQRQTLAGVSAALVISIVLGIVALFQWQEATRQAKIALARQLAAEANAVLASPNGNVEVAALLSLRAVQVQDEYIPSADAALAASLNKLYTEKLFNQHASRVSTVAYSPMGNLIAVGYVDGTAGLYDVNTGEEVRLFKGFDGYQDFDDNPQYEGVHAVSFSVKGDLLLVAGSDGRILIWNLSAEQTVADFNTGGILPLWSAKFSPDASHIVVAGGYPHSGSGDIAVFEVETGALKLTFPQLHGRYISDVEISSDGKTVLSTSFDRTAILWNMDWNTPDAEQKRVFTSSLAIRDGALSPDGKWVLLGGDTNAAELFGTDGSFKTRFDGHTNSIFSVNFSPIAGYVLTGSMDGTARLWDMQSGRTVRSFVNHRDGIFSTAFSPDGKYILTGSYDKSARLWNANPVHEARIIYGHTDPINSVSYSPDGLTILSASRDNTVRLWNSETLEPENIIAASDALYDPKAVFSAGGNWIAAGSEDYQGPNPNIVFWQKVGSAYPKPVVIPTNHVSALAFSPALNGEESQYFVSGSEDGTTEVWQRNDAGWQVVNSFFGANFPLDIAFTQDLGYIGVTNVTNESTFAHVSIYSFQSADNTVVDCVSPLSSDARFGSSTILFSSDMQFLLAQLDNDIAILDWKANAGCRLVDRMKGHSGPVTQLLLSPDGKYLLSTSVDGTAILWDVNSWKPLRTLTGHEGEIRSAGFSPDGRFIVTGGADKTIRIWDTDYKNTMQLVCSLLRGRDFTEEELAKYGIEARRTCNN